MDMHPARDLFNGHSFGRWPLVPKLWWIGQGIKEWLAVSSLSFSCFNIMTPVWPWKVSLLLINDDDGDNDGYSNDPWLEQCGLNVVASFSFFLRLPPLLFFCPSCLLLLPTSPHLFFLPTIKKCSRTPLFFLTTVKYIILRAEGEGA